MESIITEQQRLSSGHNKLIDYVKKHLAIVLSGEEGEALRQSFRYKRVRRYQYLFQVGDVCRFMTFIITGSARMFSVNEKGVEHTMSFGLESSWVSDYESFNMLTPSAYYGQVLEDTEVLLITNEQLQHLIGCFSGINNMIKLEERKQLILFQRRIHAAISMTAEERYLELIYSSPEISERFSLAMIASYLGVVPETLSRIRKNMLCR